MNTEINGSKLLLIKNIQKGFNGVPVLKGIDSEVNYGENVTIIGSSGAGKSTLVNILTGIHHADGGEIYLEGKKVGIRDPNVAERLRIGMVHQESPLCESMKAYRSIFLNRELRSPYEMLDRGRIREESHRVMESLGSGIEVDKKARDIGLMSKVIVSIVEAMLMDPKLLILDEVTVALNRREVEHLLGIICDLGEKGFGIVFIGHKIREVIQICDYVVIPRDGLEAGVFDKKTGVLDEKNIISPMLRGTKRKDEYS